LTFRYFKDAFTPQLTNTPPASQIAGGDAM